MESKGNSWWSQAYFGTKDEAKANLLHYRSAEPHRRWRVRGRDTLGLGYVWWIESTD